VSRLQTRSFALFDKPQWTAGTKMQNSSPKQKERNKENKTAKESEKQTDIESEKESKKKDSKKKEKVRYLHKHTCCGLICLALPHYG
jgi:hypothetical protein